MQIFLDHNSTTPVFPEVVDRMVECYRGDLGNAASQHHSGRKTRRIVEDAREAICDLLSADLSGQRPDRLIFTSGGTESNNLAIFGSAAGRTGRWIVSTIEHPSLTGPMEVLTQRGWQIGRLGVNHDGVVEVDRLNELFEIGGAPQHCTLVSVMLGNNETGVLQPVGELARRGREFGSMLHTDAVQVVGKMPVDFRALGVASLAFSAHKFHGPRGIGGLLVRGDVDLQPILYGGFQQGGLRPGTEPVALIAGMHQALEIWRRDQQDRLQRMTALRNRFESALRKRVVGVVVNGGGAPRLPHTSNVSFPGLDRRTMAMALDLEGLACSTGSACASGSSEPSPVLLAMGLSHQVVAGSLRFSLGATTTESEIDMAIAAVVRVVDRLTANRSGG